MMGKRRGCQATQRDMWTLLVVIATPSLDHGALVLDRLDLMDAQTRLPQSPGERLDVATVRGVPRGG